MLRSQNNMKEYAFAANPEKLQRAIAKVGRDEAAVKAEYIKLGGLIVAGYEDEEVVVEAPHPTTQEPEIVEADEPAPIEEPVAEKVSPAKKKVVKKK